MVGLVTLLWVLPIRLSQHRVCFIYTCLDYSHASRWRHCIVKQDSRGVGTWWALWNMEVVRNSPFKGVWKTSFWQLKTFVFPFSLYTEYYVWNCIEFYSSTWIKWDVILYQMALALIKASMYINENLFYLLHVKWLNTNSYIITSMRLIKRLRFAGEKQCSLFNK